jgi:broad specificity phosphatase PhoE
MHFHPMPAGTLLFLRHGATDPNLAGLRCGGDHDAALAAPGRQQARDAAQALAAQLPPQRLHLVCSDLQRTVETARILAAELAPHGIPCDLRLVPELRERRLGAWNLQPIADTQAALVAGLTPPGGEAAAEFKARIAAAVRSLLPLPPEPTLLVGSKGVARVLGELCGLPGRLDMGNGTWMRFHLAALRADPALPAVPVAPAQAIDSEWV